MLSDKPIEVPIHLEVLSVSPIVGGEESPPGASSFVLSSDFLYDEFLYGPHYDLLVVGFPEVVDVAAEMIAVKVSFL